MKDGTWQWCTASTCGCGKVYGWSVDVNEEVALAGIPGVGGGSSIMVVAAPSVWRVGE